MVAPLTIGLGLGLAVTCIGISIATLAVVLEPKIHHSHLRDRVTFWLQSLNTHFREAISSEVESKPALHIGK